MSHKPQAKKTFKRKILLVSLITVLIILFINGRGLIKSLLYYDEIKKYATVYNIDPLLVISMIYAESGFIPTATSHKGAIGLMQILPSTYHNEIKKDLNMPDDISVLNFPSENIKAGIYYLSKLKKEKWITNEIELLAAYNAGRGKVLAWKKKNSSNTITQEQIPYKETRNYIKKVTTMHRILLKISNRKTD